MASALLITSCVCCVHRQSGSSGIDFALVNVVLDLYLLRNCNWGAQSAGLIPLFRKVYRSGSCFIIIRKMPELPSAQAFQMGQSLYADLLGQGLAMGLMSSIVSNGSVILQSSLIPW